MLLERPRRILASGRELIRAPNKVSFFPSVSPCGLPFVGIIWKQIIFT